MVGVVNWTWPEKKHEFSPEMQEEAIKFLEEKLDGKDSR